MDYLKSKEMTGRPMNSEGSQPIQVSVFSRIEEIDKLLDVLKGQQVSIMDYITMIAGPMPELDQEKVNERLYDSSILQDRLSIIITNLNYIGNRYERIQRYLSTTLGR